MEAFWRHGFEGTTMATLTTVTGLNKPSLYAAFGSKEDMFRTAFSRYRERQAAFTGNLLANPDARTGVENVLLALVDSLTQPGMPHGCLMVHGNLVGSADSEEVRNELKLRRKDTEARIRERLKRAQVDGEIAATVDVADLARYIATLFQGLAVQAAGGTPRKALRRVVKLAMMVWPAST
jgi:AcrR family transcriptional regulator